jgi:O-antigen ligase
MCFNIFSASGSITGSVVPAIWIDIYIILMLFMNYSKVDNIYMFYNSININLIIMGFYIIYLIINGSSLDFEGRLVFAGLNPNRAGMALAILFVSLLSLFIVVRNKILRLLSITILVPFVFYLLKIGSRTALISVIFSLSLGMILFQRINKKYRFKMLKLAVFLITLSLIYMSITNISFNSDRLLWKSFISTGGTGRIPIWRDMITYVLLHKPLLGIGLINNTVISYGSHNLLIFLLFQMGIVGALIYITLFFFVNIKIIKCYLTGNMSLLILPLIMFLQMISNGIGEDIFYELPLWFAMGLGGLVINNSTLIRN